MIEVCLAVYKRAERLPVLIDQLNNQTNINFRLNIWNNTGEDIGIIHLIEKKFELNIFNNKKRNVGSIGRFMLVPETEGKCIIFIDDDLNLELDFIEYMYECWEDDPDSIQGWFTRVFKSSYWDSIPYNPADSEVDYVGTGGMVLSREIFDNNPCLLTPPPEMIKVEDLWLSYIAWKNDIKLYAVDPHCKIEVDGHDQYRDLITYKEDAFNYLLKLGWKDKK